MLKRILSLMLILLLASAVSFAEEFSIPGEISLNGESLFQENTQTVFKTGGVLAGETIGTLDKNAGADDFGFFANIPFDEYIALFVEEYIAEYSALPTEITGLAQYQIPGTDIGDVFYDAVLRHPETLLTTFGFSYGYNSEGYVTRIIPNYIVDNDGIEEAREAIESGIQSYVDLANTYDTDVEKLLAIHDKMVEECVYDERVLSSDTVGDAPGTVYHALGVFRDKFAVCQGYSQSLYVIAQRLGIELDFCESVEKNHMWNYVKLDGKWYHMDMTNDDPADTQGRANHTFFLFSDSKLNPLAHGTDAKRYGGGVSPVCNDTKYESDHFFNLPFPFKGFKDSDGYYHAIVNFKSTSAGINTAVDFKSKSLYTGAVIIVPIVAEGYYTTTENGQQVQKTGTNLYMMEYPTRSVGATFSVVDFRDEYLVMPQRASMSKNSAYLRLIFANAESADLSDFTSYLFGADNLTPYSTRQNWK